MKRDKKKREWIVNGEAPFGDEICAIYKSESWARKKCKEWNARNDGHHYYVTQSVE